MVEGFSGPGSKGFEISLDIFALQGSPFITLCLGSIELDRVISEPCYKRTIILRHYAEGYIVFAFPFVRLYIRHVHGIYDKVFHSVA